MQEFILKLNSDLFLEGMLSGIIVACAVNVLDSISLYLYRKISKKYVKVEEK